MNIYELKDEIETASAFCRPVRRYIYDKPYYPWLPIEPKPIPPKKYTVNNYNVNFELNFHE